jgi:hypothetical protein
LVILVGLPLSPIDVDKVGISQVDDAILSLDYNSDFGPRLDRSPDLFGYPQPQSGIREGLATTNKRIDLLLEG